MCCGFFSDIAGIGSQVCDVDELFKPEEPCDDAVEYFFEPESFCRITADELIDGCRLVGTASSRVSRKSSGRNRSLTLCTRRDCFAKPLSFEASEDKSFAP